MIAESRKYLAPLAAGQYGKGTKGELPTELSFMQLQNRHTIINCVKQAEDSEEIIVRLTNPTDKPINEKLQFHHEIKQAYLVNMNEEKVDKITISDDNTLAFEIPPFKIITVLLTL